MLLFIGMLQHRTATPAVSELSGGIGDSIRWTQSPFGLFYKFNLVQRYQSRGVKVHVFQFCAGGYGSHGMSHENGRSIVIKKFGDLTIQFRSFFLIVNAAGFVDQFLAFGISPVGHIDSFDRGTNGVHTP